MNTFLSLSPYLILIYAVYALVQSIRHQRQGLVAIILAVVVVALPLIIYITSSDFTLRLGLMSAMATSAALTCVISIVVLFIERRDPKRDKQRSYGILGITVGLFMAVGLLGGMATQSFSPSQMASLSGAAGGNGTLLNASASSTSTTGQTSPSGSAVTRAAQALTTQTGLTAVDLSTQLTAGSTIAQLVAAHKGDVTVVKTAIAGVFDELKSAGGMQAQMLSSLGTDSMDIASKLVEGQLPAQVQQIITSQMISGNMTPPQGVPGAGGASGFPAPANASASSGSLPTNPAAANGGSITPGTSSQTQAQVPATLKPTSAPPTAAPTEIVARPTLIIFPSATPTSAADTSVTTVTTGTPTVEAVEDSLATCTIVIDYNLNLRDKPTVNSSKVLVSIPFGITVTTSGRTADNWYKVIYDGQAGWVTGEYVTPQASCSQIPTISG